MEFLEKIGDAFNWVFGGMERFITRLFGASNERQMRRLGFVRKGEVTTITPGSVLDQINQQENRWKLLSDDELKQTAAKFRERLAQGETLDGILPEAFAAVREAGGRFLKMRHYDVQMIGGYVLHKGNIGEMATGEGKTLVATLPAFLNALAGHVHVVTVNDYLARRDMEWMAPVYMGLGLTVGAIQSHQETDEKAHAYACDITYGTNNEFGFDYLRDNMKPTKALQVQGPLTYAIIDEIDNILIDEARTPLIISGPAEDDIEKYRKANRLATQLKKNLHFELKEKEHTVHLTEDGVRYAEELAGVESFYTAGNMEWPHLIDNALKAHFLYKLDVNYMIHEREIVIVDEFTGRMMKGRQWSDGLHQAVEAKEGVPIKQESQTLATITLQNFFKLYKKKGGMTGTAMTEANEFWKIYGLDVIAIPSNRPSKRANFPDVIYRTEREKFNALVEEIRVTHATGRPILVGTTSIEKSELVHHQLEMIGVPHEVLNAKQHEREADIIAQAGRMGAVTIATNMAGRGTDIILGGNPEAMAWAELKQKYTSRLEVPKAEWNETSDRIATQEGMKEEGRKVAEIGGLHVIGTERHEARRIDLQLRGRAGRQGDPGSSRFFLSLEDDLMRIFAGEWVSNILTRLGMQEGEAIESGLVTSRVEGAQKKVEERNFETRKNLLEYDEVMDLQRRRVYSFRDRILDGDNCRAIITGFLNDQVRDATKNILSPDFGAEMIKKYAAQALGVEVEVRDIRGRDIADVTEYLRDQYTRQSEELIREKVDEDLPSDVEDDKDWNWQALAKWANVRFGLNTNDRELKKIGRDEVQEYLHTRIQDAIAKLDLSPVGEILAEDYGRKFLCGMLDQQFGLTLKAECFEAKSPEEARELIMAELDKLYKQKEIDFPVSTALLRFMAEDSQGGGERYDRDGLVYWANNRFEIQLDSGDVRGKPREEIRNVLRNASERYYRNGDTTGKLEDFLNRAYDGRSRVQKTEPIGELVKWTNDELHFDFTTDELLPLPPNEVRKLVLEEIEAKYRPELSQAERSLLLEVLDTSWKEHLYLMDHLRQGIGLVGYAQKDPKVEYKREGMRAFEDMWRRIGEQVTSSIFRLEEASPGFVADLWRITDMRHESAPSGIEAQQAQQAVESSGGQEPLPNPNDPANVTAVEPIRNRGERIGRNDPCPCGSGKKYKNCHMRR